MQRMAASPYEDQLADLQRQLLVLDIDRYQDREPRAARDTRRKVESWEFLQSRRIRISSLTGLDGPADVLRATLSRFSFTSTALVLRVRVLLHAVKVLQRFFRRSKRVLAQRVARVLEYWSSREAAVRETLRLSIQQFQRANAFQHAATAHPALWNDYLQCRVPKALKEKTVRTVLRERQRQWHREWQTHHEMQAKAHLLLQQERLILASNHFRTSPEIEQLREHRRLIQRIPEPVLVSDVASFSVAELLSRALEIQETDLLEGRHNYYLPGTSGEPYPTVEVKATDPLRAVPAEKAPPTLPARSSRPAANAAAEVDWRRPEYGPTVPFALSPKQQQEAWGDQPPTLDGLAEGSPSITRQRATQYCYATGRPRVRRLPTSPPPVAATEEAPDAYDRHRTLKEELRDRRRRAEGAAAGRPKAPPARQRRWPKGAVWGRVVFDDAVQTFGADTTPHVSAKPCHIRPAPGATVGKDEEPDWELELVLSKLAARKEKAPRGQPPARFRPDQHSGEAPPVDLTPRPSCSPSSPRYRPPGHPRLPPAPHRAAGGPAPSRPPPLAESDTQSATSSQAAWSGLGEEPWPEGTGRHSPQRPGTAGPSLSRPAGPESSTHHVHIGQQPDSTRRPLKTRRCLRTPAADSKEAKPALELWRPQATACRAPVGGAVLAGIAAQTGVLAALRPAAPPRGRAAAAAAKASPAAALLAHVAARQSELLKQLEDELLFSPPP